MKKSSLKVLMAGLLTTLALTGMTGCGDKNPSSSKPSSITENSTASVTPSTTPSSTSVSSSTSSAGTTSVSSATSSASTPSVSSTSTSTGTSSNSQTSSETSVSSATSSENPVTSSAQSLEEAKTNAIAELEAYKNASDYTINITAYNAAIEAGKANINAAKTVAEVNTALANAKTSIDAIDDDATAKTKAKEAKLAAIDNLYATYNLEDYRTEDKTSMQNIYAQERALVEALNTYEKITGYSIDSLKEKFDAIRTKAQLAALPVDVNRDTNNQPLSNSFKANELPNNTGFKFSSNTTKNVGEGDIAGLKYVVYEEDLDTFATVLEDSTTVFYFNYVIETPDQDVFTSIYVGEEELYTAGSDDEIDEYGDFHGQFPIFVKQGSEWTINTTTTLSFTWVDNNEEVENTKEISFDLSEIILVSELDTAKEAKLQELENLKTSYVESNYRSTDYLGIMNIINTYITNVENGLTVEGVNAININTIKSEISKQYSTISTLESKVMSLSANDTDVTSLNYYFNSSRDILTAKGSVYIEDFSLADDATDYKLGYRATNPYASVYKVLKVNGTKVTLDENGNFEGTFDLLTKTTDGWKVADYADKTLTFVWTDLEENAEVTVTKNYTFDFSGLTLLSRLSEEKATKIAALEALQAEYDNQRTYYTDANFEILTGKINDAKAAVQALESIDAVRAYDVEAVRTDIETNVAKKSFEEIKYIIDNNALENVAGYRNYDGTEYEGLNTSFGDFQGVDLLRNKDNIQMRKSSGYLYNTTAIDGLYSLNVTFTNSSSAIAVKAGATRDSLETVEKSSDGLYYFTNCLYVEINATNTTWVGSFEFVVLVDNSPEALAEAKTAKKASIDAEIAKYSADLYTENGNTLIANIAQKYKDIVDAFTKASEVNAYALTAMIAELEAVDTKAEIETAKSAKEAEINTLAAAYSEDEYTTTDYQTITTTIANLRTALTNALTVTEINAIDVAGAKTELDKLEKDYPIETLKANKTAELNALYDTYTSDMYSTENWTTVDNLIKAKLAAVESATTREEVISIDVETLKVEINKVETLAQLNAAKATRIQEIETLASEYKDNWYDEAPLATLKGYIQAAKDAVNALTTVADVNAYDVNLVNLKAQLDSVEKNGNEQLVQYTYDFSSSTYSGGTTLSTEKFNEFYDTSSGDNVITKIGITNSFIESGYIRIGTSKKDGSITLTTSTAISKVIVVAKNYDSTSATLTINNDAKDMTSSYLEYEYELAEGCTSIKLSALTSKRVSIQSIVLVA